MGTPQLPAPFEPNPTLYGHPSLHNALLKVGRVFCATLYYQPLLYYLRHLRLHVLIEIWHLQLLIFPKAKLLSY